MDILQMLYDTVLSRKGEKQEGSYTCYLFEQGTDKILKKCGEECSEVIIAAKNGKNEDTVGELSDLLYHLTVLMVNEGIDLEDVRAELEKRFGTASIILISHRITTLSKADKIIVLDSGRIVEEGTHDELKQSGGVYQQIYEIQTGVSKEVV